MTDEDLRNRLKAFPVPAPTEKHLEMTRAAALRALEHRANEEGPVSIWQHWRVTMASLGLAACCLAVGLMWYFARHRTAQGSSPGDARQGMMASEETVVHELVTLFPGRVNAVIERNGEREVILAGEGESFDTQPVVLDLQREGKHVRVLTFSGQRVSVPLSGRQVEVEILVSESNGIVLLAQNRVLLPGPRTLLEGYVLSACALKTL